MTQLALLYAAPALLLWTLLIARRYPGEQLLARARRPASKRHQRVAVPVEHAPRRTLAFRRRNGVIVACHLAGRAPPQTAAP